MNTFAQVTTSGMSGFVRAAAGEALIGATVTATHQPTGTVYRTVTKTDGKFDINNMNPGGPYSIVVSYVNFQPFTRGDVFLTLGENSRQDFQMATSAAELSTVVVSTSRTGNQGKGGTETTIGRDRIANIPSVGRNITDLLRAVPQAKISNTNEGAISIAGQNNRYNAFYIDGALNNDVFGLAASGTNGGQANIAPISLDAIDQIQVSISPYDPSLSGFTGGGINAVTRSGTNNIQGSAYYIFRNQALAGKTPTGLKASATRFPEFGNKTFGFRVGGPIVQNKAFFFINAELQRDERPQPFEIGRYGGSTSEAGLNALADTLRRRYNYEPGGFLNNPETVNANRIVTKFDWNISEKNKFSLSYRYNDGERFNTSSSSNSTINFYNNGYRFPTTTHSVAAELRSSFTGGSSNRLLLTYGNVNDNRDPIGQAFPRVLISDGSGAIIFGPDNSSTINLLTQRNFNFFDMFRFSAGKHSFSVGTDNELNNVYNAFIQNTFGNYQYSSLADFYANARPRQYQVGYSLIDNKQDETTEAAAKFKTGRLAVFAGDEFRPNSQLTLNFGIRADKFAFITDPKTDPFTNDSALAKFSQYYDLQGARSGLKPNIPVSISPRFGFTYRIPDENMVIRGGLGLFTGRVPLVWPGGIYNNNGINQGGFTVSSSQNSTVFNQDLIRFRPDPMNQYRASDFNINLSKGGLNLISANFRLPKVFRTTLAFDKQLGRNWTFTMEGVYSKNINETYYTNINILPPVGQSKGPGTRNVYPASNTIPIQANGRNPYDNAILLSNGKGDLGYSYSLTGTIDKRFTRGFSLNVNYTYGDAIVVHEPTSSVNFSQWRFVETVNGRNFIGRSISDFSPGHRIFAYASKRFEYVDKRFATTISFVYTGQSGNPFSYVYGSNSAVRDDFTTGATNDLVYIPTAAELQTMTFTTNTVNGVPYTADQQRTLFNRYVDNNDYLRSRRGMFAERNGDRMPFTHIIDAKIAQDVNVTVGGKRISFQVTYDVFNLTNMLNRNWGRTYFLSNDNFRLLEFQGYSADLTPSYRFNPTIIQPQSENNISTSAVPSFSARWTSQLGFRINF
jgi:outer membrane receptor for ferrienterochelin and colicin